MLSAFADRRPPGRISDDLRAGFQQAGYPLQTYVIQPPCLIEVYPPPSSLVELANASKRLPYKHTKIRKYWPTYTPPQRRDCLYQTWITIVDLLEDKITGARERLSQPNIQAKGKCLKAYEDKLDAVICAWVGICALEGRAKRFGDVESAIWVPNSAVRKDHSEGPDLLARSRRLQTDKTNAAAVS